MPSSVILFQFILRALVAFIILVIFSSIPFALVQAGTYSCIGAGCTAIDTNGCSSNTITGQSACGCSYNGKEIVCSQVVQNGPSTSQLNISTQDNRSHQFCTGGTCTYTPLEPLPLPGTNGGSLNESSLGALISSSFQLLLAMGAIVAVIVLVLGGISYMFSDVITTKLMARSRIRNAMWAIVILASSYLILNTINPQLVMFSSIINPLPSERNDPSANPAQASSGASGPTASQAQAAVNSCNMTCGNLGGSVYTNPDNSMTCRCGVRNSPI